MARLSSCLLTKTSRNERESVLANDLFLDSLTVEPMLDLAR
jgi:hypothetical protein